MSRQRSRLSSAPYLVQHWYGQTPDGINGYWSGDVRTNYNTNLTVCDVIDSSVMVDNISPSAYPSDQYHGCDHTKSSCSGFAEVAYTFSPPTPPLYIQPRVCINPKMPNIPTLAWDDLIDDLAGQLERGSESSFQALVFIAEARKTWEMIRNPLSFLKPNYRKKVRGKTTRGLEISSSVWLSGRYGWKPFLSDVTNFSVLTAKLMTSSLLPKLQKRFAARKRTLTTSSIEYTNACSQAQWAMYSQNFNWSNSKCLFYRLKDYQVELSLSASCYAWDPMMQISNLFDRLLVNAGATVTWRNIRDVIWEILPFSFVIDWFVDFSNAWRPLNESSILQKAASRLGYSYKSKTSFRPDICVGHPWPVTWEPGSLWYNKPITTARVIRQPTHCSATRYHRDAGLPYSASTIFKQNGLTLIHGIDGVSLILQKLLNAKTHH